MVTVGDTFTAPCLKNGKIINHLHVILTSPFNVLLDGIDVEVVIMVNATTIYDGVDFDPACKLVNGDHTLITHDSYIIYKKAVVTRISEVQDGVKKKVFSPSGKASAALMKKIITGLGCSKHIPQKIKNAYASAIKAGKA